jgi:hypothetical protein
MQMAGHGDKEGHGDGMYDMIKEELKRFYVDTASPPYFDG